LIPSTAQALSVPTPRFEWQRITGVFGLAWIVLFAVGGIALQGQPPAYDAPIAEIRDFFAANGGRYLWGDYIAGLAFILCLLPFVVAADGDAADAGRSAPFRVLSGAPQEDLQR
jgi:hypothetical protein